MKNLLFFSVLLTIGSIGMGYLYFQEVESRDEETEDVVVVDPNELFPSIQGLSVTIEADKESYSAFEQGSAEVTLNIPARESIRTAEFVFQYDPANLRIDSIEGIRSEGGFTTFLGEQVIRDDGIARISATNLNNTEVRGNIPAVRINFTKLSQEGTFIAALRKNLNDDEVATTVIDTNGDSFTLENQLQLEIF